MSAFIFLLIEIRWSSYVRSNICDKHGSEFKNHDLFHRILLHVLFFFSLLSIIRFCYLNILTGL